MQIQSADIVINNPAPAKQQSQIEDYAEVLQNFNLAYLLIGYHLQVGKIEQTKGWILHISVVRSQMAELLNIIIPVLEYSCVSFKLVKDREKARILLDGIL